MVTENHGYGLFDTGRLDLGKGSLLGGKLMKSRSTIALSADVGVEKLKVRSDLHIPRRLFHVFGVLIIIACFSVFTREQSLLALGIAMAVIVPLDIFRLKIKWLNKLLIKSVGVFVRKTEVNRLSAQSHLLLGTMVTIYFFPKEIATLALLFLAFGDPVASIFGVLFGKDKIIGNKSLQGTIAAFTVCTILSLLYLSSIQIMTERLLLAAFLSGIIGALSELIPVGQLDDNFSMPVISATLLWGVFFILGGFA
jgi:diacylglycerol kinase (CTP)